MLEKKSQWLKREVVILWGGGEKVKQIKDTKDEQSAKWGFLILNRRKNKFGFYTNTTWLGCRNM